MLNTSCLKANKIIVLLVLACLKINSVFGQYSCLFSDYRFNSISTQDGLSQSSVLSFVQDPNGFIWMGTKYGLNRYDGYTFTTYNYNTADSNSLKSNEIIKLYVDKHGDLLIGARSGGLSKYYYRTNSFVQFSGIPQNVSVNAIFEDEDSILWIGTSIGLFKGTLTADGKNYDFHNLTEQAIFLDSRGKPIPSSKVRISVVTIYKETDNNFLVGSEDGLFAFSPRKEVFRLLDLGIQNEIKIVSVLKDKKSRTYIGSNEGLIIVDSSKLSGDILTYYNTLQPENRRLNVNWINQVILDKNNTIWGGTRGGGLFKIDSTGKIENFVTQVNYPGSISDNVINSLLVDNTDVLWIGTESRGCNTLDLNRKRFKHLEIEGISELSLQSQQVTAITGSGTNTIWIGTASNGILKVDKTGHEKFKVSQIKDLNVLNRYNSNEIIALHFDYNQSLWMGMTLNSIVKLDKNNRISAYQTDGFVFCIHEDKHHNIWYGTWGDGFGKVDQKNNTTVRFSSSDRNLKSLNNDIVLAINDDYDNNLWVGTKGGGLNISPIAILEQGEGTFAGYQHIEKDTLSLSNNHVTCIFVASDSAVWIGTENGLNKVIYPKGFSKLEAIMQGKLKFESYYLSDGLPNNAICGILQDSRGFLWISTMDGLSRFNTSTKKFTNYSYKDGLQANEFHTNAYYKANGDEFFFGGINGITTFNPASIQQNPHLPNVVITGLKIFNNKVVPNEKIQDRIILTNDISNTRQIILNHRHKEISFDFSGMHFSNTENIKYAYRLVGFNDQWREIDKGEHSANYTNLYEGEYIFEVKASNNDGVWSYSIARIEIKILPPFWRNPFFYLVYAGLILIFLFLFRRYSLIAAKEKTKLKIEALERKKQVEITESKMRFFTNISHEIRTPLTLIYTPLEKVLNQGKLDDESRSNLNLVKKNVSRLLNLTNQLLQLRKIDLGVLEPKFEKVLCIAFIKEILEYFEQFAKRKSISLVLNSTTFSDEEEFWIDKEMITTAIYNLLSNALKYSNNEGMVAVTLEKADGSKIPYSETLKKNKLVRDWLIVDITDNGAGISEKELSNIFTRFYQGSNTTKSETPGSGIGLSIVKEYIELHYGTVTASSQPGFGTTIKFILPLGREHIPERLIKEVPTSQPVNHEELAVDTSEKFSFTNAEAMVDEELSNRPVVLIVDDDLDMLSFLHSHLSVKYNVLEASNGKDAWNIIRKELPQLVLSDIMMPEIDGSELCRMIKNNIETSHIPIILLTAKAGDENIIVGYENRADRYITKPFSLEVLEAQIDQLLDTRKKLIELFSKKVILKPKDISITPLDEKYLTRLMDIIEKNISNPEFDVSQIVDKMNMSHSAVLKKIKALTNLSLVEFVRHHRLNKAALIFEKEKLPVNEVAYMVGFSDAKYFSKCFSKQFGKTPTDYANDLGI